MIGSRLFCALPLLVGLTMTARADDRSDKRLRACQVRADACGQALLRSDYPEIVRCTLPAIVEGIGGAEAMTKMIRNGKEEWRSQGIEMRSVTVDLPKEILRAETYSFAVLPQSLTMKVSGGTLLARSFVIGVSTDGGSHWWFVDGANLTPEKLKIVLPAFPATVKLPEKQKPTFTPDAQR
jgi:hypothetical protein